MNDFDKFMTDAATKIQSQLQEEQDVELMQWLGVETQERATQVIERLQELGLTVDIQTDPIKIEVIEDEDGKMIIQAESDVRFKLIPLKP